MAAVQILPSDPEEAVRNAIALAIALLALPGQPVPANCPPVDCFRGLLEIERQEREFDLSVCSARATHILVVDARGVVLDVWKGEARPGDVIPLDALLRPANPAADVTLRELESYWYDRPRGERIILFLVKTVGREWEQPADSSGWSGSYGYRGRYEAPVEPFGHSALNRLSLVTTGRPSLWEQWAPVGPSGAPELSTAWVDEFGSVRVGRWRESLSRRDRGPAVFASRWVDPVTEFRRRVEAAIPGTSKPAWLEAVADPKS